jgi:hypothetical protein
MNAANAAELSPKVATATKAMATTVSNASALLRNRSANANG